MVIVAKSADRNAISIPPVGNPGVINEALTAPTAKPGADAGAATAPMTATSADAIELTVFREDAELGNASSVAALVITVDGATAAKIDNALAAATTFSGVTVASLS